MIYQLSAISSQQSVLSYLSFPRKLESSSLTSSLSGLTGQSRTKVLDSPIKSGNDRKKLRRDDGKKGRNDYNFTVFNSSEAGFTLVELMITMVIFLIVIAAASGILTGMITQFKQQSKIAETNIEGIVGLDIMRWDIEHAGYGLPWVLGGAAYSEALNDTATTWNDQTFNDGPPNNPQRGTCPDASPLICNPASSSNPPGAIRSGNGLAINGSDVLVIKAVNVATNVASSKWTHLFTGNTVTKWNSSSERLVTSDRVIVLSPNTRTLIVNGANFTTRYDANTDPNPDRLMDAAFAPPDNTETYVVYGITLKGDPVVTALTMPFNRADFYIKTPTANFPSRCATGTGILYKGTISQNDGSNTPGAIGQELPLLDCVADMQVVYLNAGAYTADISALSAQQIREQVREVRVYILAHEGQYDRDFTFDLNSRNAGLTPSIACLTCIRVGEFGLGQDFDLSGITNWQNYRWKVYTIVVKPINLR